MKGMRILITGGAGFIGTHLAERFCDANKVVIFDDLRRNSLREVPALKRHPNVMFIKGTVLDRDSLARAVKRCDVVLHLAAIAGVSSYYKDPAETLRVNLIGTINLLEICRTASISKFVYFSTSEVYGREALRVNEEELYRVGPMSDARWSYAISKIAGENIVVRYGDRYGFSAFSIRPFNVYGPRQTGEGAIGNFLRAVAGKGKIVINGNGSPVRAWCYISDCVDAVEALMMRKGISNGAFNVGNPRETYTTIELARLVLEETGAKIPIVFKSMKRTEIQMRVPDIRKAQRILGFKPKVTLREGIELTYPYYKQYGR